jgi:hypothetical protein
MEKARGALMQHTHVLHGRTKTESTTNGVYGLFQFFLNSKSTSLFRTGGTSGTRGTKGTKGTRGTKRN